MKYIIIGTIGAVTYKNVFPYIKEGKLFYGNRVPFFDVKDEGQSLVSAVWYNNIKPPKRDKLELTETFDIKKNPKYDNYCAFEVGRTKDIPKDDYIIIDIPDEEWEMWKSVYGEDIECLKK